MFNYYHIYPTCPHCLEPHFNGIPLIKSVPKDFCQKCKICRGNRCEWDVFDDNDNAFNDLYHCQSPSCDAVFYKYIDLSKFKETKAEIGLEDNKIPLIWPIEPNIIEKEYINWIDKIKGKYLITWPWGEVKFIPLFITEYISKYQNNTIVIVDEFDRNYSESVMKPTSLDLFEFLIYSSKKIKLNEEKLKKEYNKFDSKNLFKKINRFHHKITFKGHIDDCGYEGDFNKIYKDKTLSDYNKSIIKELRDVFGKTCIKEDIVDGKRSKVKGYSNEDGFIKLKVDKQFSRSQQKFKFKKNQLWEAIINSTTFNRAKNDLKYTLLKSEDDFDLDNDTQIYFISKDLTNVFDIINEINPTIVLFPNADYFMIEYSIYYSEEGRKFNNFIENTFSDCLLFSTNKDIRHLYSKNDFLVNNEMTIHTWDSDLILSRIEDEEHYVKTAGSSSFKDITFSSELCIKYLEVTELNCFEELIYEIDEKNKIYKEYLSKLIRSPSLISSDDDNLELQLFNKDINFDSIVQELKYINNDLSDKLEEIYSKFYLNDNNPILTKILETMNKQLEFNKKVLVVFNNTYEVGLFKRILKYKHIEFPDSVEILTWSKDFSNIGNNSVIISTSYPNISYKLYNSDIEKFIFIGSKKYLETIRTIVENRVDSNNCRPIHYIPGMNYPKLLNEVLESSNIEIKKIAEMDEYFFDDEIDIKEDYESISIVDSISRNAIIEEGETALLLLNNEHYGLFLPKKYRVMFKDPKKIVNVIAIDEKEENYNKLKNKEIVLNKKNFMISYKDIFYKFVVDNGNNIKITSKTYEWENFFELIESIFDWRFELNNCLETIEDDSNIKPIDKLAYELSKSKTFASDTLYIKNFWLSDLTKYELKTKYDTLTLYDIELPKNKYKDLKEIYAIIKNHNPSINVEEKAYKNYIAYTHFKKIRDSFLKHDHVNPRYEYLYVNFKQELNTMLRRQELFKVFNVKKVKLSKSVIPFKKMSDFQEYYES